MDQELHVHLTNISTQLATQTAKLDAVKESLDYHITRDEAKFKDLYDRHNEHDKFQARVKGVGKGMGLLSVAVASVLGFWQQLVEAFK